ncbi:Outer membrane protein beta-barrel domain-containing protein [Chryseobacterium taeanense]|uniref:Outer membrane protein beta-barrel domain-containing protein n=1 Tax=Chryseobacterium taeanense TaxID=311334 RepID=A0A1G8JVF6_9FLAO|nr:outer membrane beta-barrel protein [Chryseobacterium taeanense]SDI35192.1 Outer membrane protein beta-barrel domain-containing protein [Chryseobacterium taeanense]
MKKIISLFTLIISGFSLAQVTFNPGIRAGANFSHFTNKAQWYSYMDFDYSNSTEADINFKNKTDFYIGLFGNIRFAKFYALQPEINYSRQGTKLDTNINNWDGQTITASYIGFQIVNKFYFNKFNIHVGPTMDFLVEQKNFEATNEVDLGITAGIGVDITNNFGIEARVKKGFIPVYTFYNDHSNITFQAGVYYTFNMKK